MPVMQASTEGLGLGFTPMGPTWQFGAYFLGADSQGRDVVARLLYGGRNSLLIAGAATADLPGARRAGRHRRRLFRRRRRYRCSSRLLDVLWAFPIYLLAISLSIVLITQGLSIGPFTIELGQPVAADLHHRHRLRALCGAADPRPGAGA